MRTVDISERWPDFGLPDQIADILRHCKSLCFPRSREEVFSLAVGGQSEGSFEVAYEVPRRGRVVEATVTKCRNGVAVNYAEPYMRRRDPDCSVIGDARPTDQQSYQEPIWPAVRAAPGRDFRVAERPRPGGICLHSRRLRSTNRPRGVVDRPEERRFLHWRAWPTSRRCCHRTRCRRTSACGRRSMSPRRFGTRILPASKSSCIIEQTRYMKCFPTTSIPAQRKKGIYGVLLAIGEDEDWLTLHASTVQVVTPYDNITTIMHEGASGSGKSEMLEYVHRQEDGRLLLGKNWSRARNGCLS